MGDEQRYQWRHQTDLPDGAVRGGRDDDLEGVHVLQLYHLGEMGSPRQQLFDDILTERVKTFSMHIVVSQLPEINNMTY